jgi:hypothetical protein
MIIKLTNSRAFLACGRIGRLWAVRELCTIWVLGIALFMDNNGNLRMVYAGRFIAGSFALPPQQQNLGDTD